MAATLFPGKRLQSGRRGLSIIECLLALSVIVGFLFVTVRVMTLEVPAPSTQVVATDTVAATPRLGSETADTKTP
jgi:hypothetical protein